MTRAVAIDGPAGAGKSSIARSVAAKLGYIYVDTGALYRAVGYFMAQNGIDTKNNNDVTPMLSKIKVELAFLEGEQHVFVNGEDVSQKIRTPEMAMHASNVSAIKSVRDFLFDLQRDIASNNNVIMDGRDIGTVVLPNADVKIFLTASPEARAQRRYLEHKQKGEDVLFEEILDDIVKRDYNDSNRAIAPLKKSDEHVLVETTSLSLEESIEAVMRVITG